MLQHLSIFLVVRGPNLNTGFEVQPHQCRAQGHDHFPSLLSFHGNDSAAEEFPLPSSQLSSKSKFQWWSQSSFWRERSPKMWRSSVLLLCYRLSGLGSATYREVMWLAPHCDVSAQGWQIRHLIYGRPPLFWGRQDILGNLKR